MASANPETKAPLANKPGAVAEWQPAELERIRVRRVVNLAFAETTRLLRVRPDELLRLAYGNEVSPTGTVISFVPHPRAPWLRLPVRAECSTPAPDARGVMISIRWEATRFARFFPVMETDLSVHPRPGNESELVLDGRYRPPLGLAGLLLDRLVGRWVASNAARSFVNRVATCLEES